MRLRCALFGPLDREGLDPYRRHITPCQRCFDLTPECSRLPDVVHGGSEDSDGLSVYLCRCGQGLWRRFEGVWQCSTQRS